jgi:Xaa-Pro aminopeptidase
MTGAERVAQIQEALREERLAGWLLFDFHGTNPIARSVALLPDGPGAPKTSRRWFYFVPAKGAPEKLVHRLEPHALDHLPGETRVYLTWEELDAAVAAAVQRVVRIAGTRSGNAPAIAMEYSPRGSLPYVSRVDAGTVELIRDAGAQVVTSADLAQRFDGVLDPAARADHVKTGRILHAILGEAFAKVRDAVRVGMPVLTEVSLQHWILERFAAENLIATDPPTVAVNAHSGDPHFSTAPTTDAPIREGDFLLLDAWCKAARPGSVYADYTQVAFVGSAVPERIASVFGGVRDARDAAIEVVRAAVQAGRVIRGCDVDDVARGVMRARGLAEHFVHRTGHSIGQEVHANGVHLDNLETRDERRILDGTLVSVEPGAYFEDLGVRSEINLLVDGRKVIVTTEPVQQEVPALLA